MTKIKILAIDQGEHIGGAERFFAEALSYLGDHFEVHLLTEKNPDYLSLYKKNSIRIHHVGLPRLKPVNWKNFRQFKKSQAVISKLLDEIQPTIVLSNTVRTHLLISSLAAQREIPLLWMAHDLTFPSSLLWWYRRYPQVIIACSEFVKHYYRGRSKTPDIEVVYPFVVSEEKAEKLKSVQKKKIIGMIGKFIPWKGQDTFIRMAKNIHELHQDYQFVIVGEPYKGNTHSEAYFEYCQKLLNEDGIGASLQIKSGLSEILGEIAEWEILVHCSREPEPLGRVVLEGMAAGCAVVASKLGGPQETIDDQQTGLLITPDVHQLTVSVEQLIEHPELARALSEKARDEIKEKFSPKMIFGKIEEILLRMKSVENGKSRTETP